MARQKASKASIFICSLSAILILSSCTTGKATGGKRSSTSGFTAASTGFSVSAAPNIPLSQPQRIFYEIFVASYYDSDGDGTGDFTGVAQKLDYLTDGLGISGIWLMPVMKSPTYHKYDVADYYTPDESYGSIDDFKNLASACHEKNVALIIDMPLNHCSSENPWFVAACKGDEKYRDWFNFSDTFQSGYHLVQSSVLGDTSGASTPKALQANTSVVPGKYYEGHFTSTMPDFNLDCQDLRSEILSICKYWMDAGVDGFRLDAVHWFYNGNTSKNIEFLSWLMTELRSINPDVYVVGEAWTDSSVVAKLYDSRITSLFNFGFAQSTGKIISCVRSGKGSDLSSSLEKWYTQIPETAVDAPFLTNHDQSRSSGALMNNLSLQKMAASVYLLLPGSPFIYYGEEIGMQGGSGKDENKRTAMVWEVPKKTDSKKTSSTKLKIEGMCNSPNGADDIRTIEAGVKEQLVDKESLLSFYREVIKVKNRYPLLSSGRFTAITVDNNHICAYKMQDEKGKSLIVIHNLSEEKVTIDLANELDYFTSDECVETLCAGEKAKLVIENGVLTLAGYMTVVLY